MLEIKPNIIIMFLIFEELRSTDITYFGSLKNYTVVNKYMWNVLHGSQILIYVITCWI